MPKGPLGALESPRAPSGLACLCFASLSFALLASALLCAGGRAPPAIEGRRPRAFSRCEPRGRLMPVRSHAVPRRRRGPRAVLSALHSRNSLGILSAPRAAAGAGRPGSAAVATAAAAPAVAGTMRATPARGGTGANAPARGTTLQPRASIAQGEIQDPLRGRASSSSSSSSSVAILGQVPMIAVGSGEGRRDP